MTLGYPVLMERPEDRLEESLRESFPASDPPAIHASDDPPTNAQAKWDLASPKAGRKRRIPEPER